MSNKVFIRYTPQSSNEKRQQIAGFRYEGMSQWNEVNKFREGTNGEIKCLECGANNWTENGRSINEYECGSCGAFISVEPIK